MAKEKDDNKDIAYWNIMDIPQVTVNEAADHLRLSMSSKQQRGAIILVGESGLGKTQIVKQIARAAERRVATLNLAQFITMGAGVPQRTEGDHFKIAVPDYFPKEGEKAILFCDEINQGMQHSLAMFYNLIEDRRLFNYKLPDDCLVVGAMNPSGGSYSVSTVERSPAFRRRVKFMYVIPDFKGWYAHASSEEFHADSQGPARGQACHPAILSYFKAHPKALYDTKARDAGKQFMCPAAVETLSEDAYNITSFLKNRTVFGDFAQTRYAASVGTAMATQLCAYMKDASSSIGADDVLSKYPSIQVKVAKLVEKGEQEKVADLANNVVQLLFATSPDVKLTADNFLAFLKDIPKDLADDMCIKLKTVATSTDSMTYFRKFLVELQGRTEWEVIQLGLDSNHRAVAEALQPKKK
jgi:hypothetical protein